MSFVEFLMQYYVWILAVLGIAIVTVIGFLADKRDKKKKKQESAPAAGVAPATTPAMEMGQPGVAPSAIQPQPLDMNMGMQPNMNIGNMNPQSMNSVNLNEIPSQPLIKEEVPVAPTVNPVPGDIDYKPLSDQKPSFAPKSIEIPTPVMNQAPVQPSVTPSPVSNVEPTVQPIVEPVAAPAVAPTPVVPSQPQPTVQAVVNSWDQVTPPVATAPVTPIVNVVPPVAPVIPQPVPVAPVQSPVTPSPVPHVEPTIPTPVQPVAAPVTPQPTANDGMTFVYGNDTNTTNSNTNSNQDLWKL